MSGPAAPESEGPPTITPHLTVRNAARAIDFYRQAFGAQEVLRMPSPDGRSILHAELRIGGSVLYLNDEDPDEGCFSPESLGGNAMSLQLYVDDVDTVFELALAHGATVRMPVEDMFWGDRYGKIVDPFGYEWAIATRREVLTPEEVRRRAEEFAGPYTAPHSA